MRYARESKDRQSAKQAKKQREGGRGNRQGSKEALARHPQTTGKAAALLLTYCDPPSLAIERGSLPDAQNEKELRIGQALCTRT
mmetsp:Transcript_91466/g.258289  ORF Transcript_91466/g.258289 Transcript_91466/m.258289 type:complete len:84 (-) Transcript_91466:18-269(-)